jgi:putative pyruvate formate lyase activating enzyme
MWKPNPFNWGTNLKDPGVLRALPRYVDVVEGNKLPKFIIAKRMAADYDKNDEPQELLAYHWKHLSKYLEVEEQMDQDLLSLDELGGDSSFLDLKIEIGMRIMSWCRFCEHRCGVDRLKGEKGYCRCGDDFSLASCFPHMGEEPELVPSGTIFTYGCSIRCIHCQNWDISQWRGEGSPVSPREMARLVEGLKRKGCRNVNMVGGDPTPNTALWLSTMKHVNLPIPTIWNSNSYYSRETAMLLAGFIDLYLLDFKYGDDEHAKEISDAPGYWEAATRNHLLAKEYGEIIVRVLVLPGHLECCTKPILDWISGNLGPWTRVNLMFQYRPEWRAREREELRRRLTSEERLRALEIAKEAGLKNFIT